MSEGWLELREGIKRKPLAADRERGIQFDLIKIRPNFDDNPHVHDGFEWVYILEGGFTDDAGEHKAGDFLKNSTEGVHQVKTGPEGCTLLIVWTGSVTEVDK